MGEKNAINIILFKWYVCLNLFLREFDSKEKEMKTGMPWKKKRAYLNSSYQVIKNKMQCNVIILNFSIYLFFRL